VKPWKGKVTITIPREMAKKGTPIPVGDIIQTHFLNLEWKKCVEELCKKHPELRKQLATYEKVTH
jgi:hypothetical protein